MGDGLAHVLEARVEAHPDRLLFSFVGGNGAVRQRYTYGSFLARTSHVGRCLLDAGLAPGDAALLVFPPGLDMAVAFFAAVRVGVIPVPAPPPSHLKLHAGWGRLAHIAADAGARHVLATKDLVARVATLGESEAGSPAGAVAALRWIATDTLEGRLASPLHVPSNPLFIQYTSGSTSAPRGVAVSHANVLHNARFAVGHDRPVGVSWLPHFHDMGLLGYYLFSLIRGGEATCFSPLDFLRRPVLWLELVSRVGATITTAPNAAYEYCLRTDKVPDEQIVGLDLGSLRFMVNAAEPVRAGTFERFRRRFSRRGLRRDALVTAYGLAEHTLCVTTGGSRIVDRDGEGTDVGTVGKVRFVSCGRPEADVDVRIVDPETRRLLADGAVGEIWVDSASKATGYWRKPELSDRQFRAVIAGDKLDRTYLRTGDLGFLDAGELFVCGRLRDMLVLNGRNVFPGDIEALVEEALPALAGRVAAFGTHSPEAGTEALVIVVEAGADAPDLSRVRCVVQERAGVPVGVVARMPRGAILRTSSGKIARRLCRENFESGASRPLETLVAADDKPAGTIEALIDGLVAQAAALGNSDATLDQLGLDSIAFVNLSLALEELLDQEGLATPALIEQVSDLSLLQALRVSDLRAALVVLRSGQAGAQSLLRVIDGVAGQVREDERARMRADAAMPLPIVAAAMTDSPRSGHALITGATGFLGGYILRSLLDLTGEPVTVLVRADSAVEANARIRRTLLDTGMTPAAIAAALRSRVGVVPADLTLPRFGLDDRAWESLAGSVDRIYHSAAEVDYVKSYNLLRPANVAGTREVIALAAEGCRKALHYISTTFIFGWSVKPFLFEADDNPEMQNLDFGYAQSKWVAEQLVLRAGRGGLPVTVYRPSLVTASALGRFVRRDITARVVGYMIRRGLSVDAPNQVSFLPVDLTARNIVALSRSDAAVAPVLHMTSDEHYTIGDVCRHIADRFGYAFREVSLEGFVEHAHAHCGPDDDLYPLLSFLDRNTSRIVKMGAKRYDSAAYRAARDAAPLALQHPTLAATVDPIVAYLRAEGLIPPAPRRHRADTIGADAAGALA